MFPHILLGSAVSLFACLLPIVFQTTTQIQIVEKRVLERIVSVFLVSVGGSSFISLVSSPVAAQLFFWFVFVVAMNDSGAYFVGARYSSPALSPVLSPKKTILGSVGGLVIGFIAGLVALFVLPLGVKGWSLTRWGLFLSGMLVLILLAQLGDLLKSMIKRSHGIKDMGSVLPGHGGVLDRIDGILMACPFFLAFFVLLKYYQ